MQIIVDHIRDIPDFPKPGIVFKDITPVLSQPEAFRACITGLKEAQKALNVALICGIESRGFIFGAPMATDLNLGFIPIRKPGKLPYKTISESYSLEYGTNTLEIHEDAIQAGQRVLIVDDLLATGGTAAAAGKLVERVGGIVAGYAFVVELGFLQGRQKLGDPPIIALVTY